MCDLALGPAAREEVAVPEVAVGHGGHVVEVEGLVDDAGSGGVGLVSVDELRKCVEKRKWKTMTRRGKPRTSSALGSG